MQDDCNLIYKTRPKNNEKIDKKKVKIKVYLKDALLNLKDIKVLMYLNKENVKLKRYKNKLEYACKKKLQHGKYIVDILIYYNDTEKQKYSWTFFVSKQNKEKINCYFGNLHSHTAYSSGQGTPKEAFKMANDMGIDFLAVTDHSKSLKTKKIELYKKQSDKFNKKNKKTLALYGKELSIKGIGHINLLNCNDLDKYKINDLNSLNNFIKQNDETILCINHPQKSIYKLCNQKHLNKNIKLIEVGNGVFQNKYNRYEKYYYKMLDCGWHLSAVNNQDNHKKDWGKSDNLTVILADKLKEKNILSALNSGRTYSTESRNLNFMFKINNAFMGDSIDFNNLDNLNFFIKCYDKKFLIRKVQIISNNSNIISEKEFNDNKIEWCPIIKKCKQNSWYVVKVFEDDNRIAISSPIYLNNI